MNPKNKESVGVSESPHSSSEKEEVEAWLRTIESTVRWRDGILDKMGCKRFIDEYKNKWDWLQASTSIPVIPINLVYAFVKTEVARLYFRDPWITVNPKRHEDIGASQIAEQIINYLWIDLKLKPQIKQTILEAELVGHSWMKVGYAAEFGTVESQPKEEKRGPGRPSTKKFKEVETNEYIKSESVFAYHVPYKDIVFDPSATYPCTHNARWMAHKIVKPYRAVVQSGIYENTDKLNPNSKIQDPNSNFSIGDSLQEGFGKDVKSVILWEIYDLDHQTITTVSPGCKYKLREIPLPDYFNGGFPFVQFSFNPVPGDVYPLSDIAPHEGQIIEMIKMVSIELNHLKRWNRQMIVDAGTFTKEEKQKFTDANDGAVIESLGTNAKDKIFVPPYAPVQSDIYGVFQQIFQMWQMISGQTSADQGGQAKTQTRTLGELRMSMQGSKSRSEEKIDVLEDSIAEVARKLMSIIQKKYDLPKITRIVGPKSVQEKILKILPQRPSAQPMVPGQPGQPPQPNPIASQSFQSDFGFSWNRTDIMGEMDVDVLAGSTVPMDRESQLQIMEKMIPLLQAAGVTPGSPPAKAFAREFLRLVGIMSLETVMDLIESQPQQPPPKMMETQVKVQAKMAETQMKLKGKQAEQQIKLEGMREKLNIDREKGHMGLQKDIIHSVLEQFRGNSENSSANSSANGDSNEQI
jgi:hypothetical protein